MAVNSRKIALSGVLLALLMLTVFFATVFPTNKISLYALSSFYICIIIIEFGLKAGWVFYISSCLLAGIVFPNKTFIIPYILLFGIYGIIKYYIERLNKIVLEYVIKYLYFNIFLFISILIMENILIQEISSNLSLWIVIVVFEAVFLIYDYVYTLFIQYYRTRIRKILKL